MGYYDILKILEKQLDDIETEHEYLKNKRDKAIKTKKIAEELDLNIRSVRAVIHKMKKRDEIEVMQGIIDTTERYYILSQKYMENKKWKPKQ